jgi:hypothetical protein
MRPIALSTGFPTLVTVGSFKQLIMLHARINVFFLHRALGLSAQDLLNSQLEQGIRDTRDFELETDNIRVGM